MRCNCLIHQPESKMQQQVSSMYCKIAFAMFFGLCMLMYGCFLSTALSEPDSFQQDILKLLVHFQVLIIIILLLLYKIYKNSPNSLFTQIRKNTLNTNIQFQNLFWCDRISRHIKWNISVCISWQGIHKYLPFLHS